MSPAIPLTCLVANIEYKVCVFPVEFPALEASTYSNGQDVARLLLLVTVPQAILKGGCFTSSCLKRS